jgi:hypothetical protein
MRALDRNGPRSVFVVNLVVGLLTGLGLVSLIIIGRLEPARKK